MTNATSVLLASRPKGSPTAANFEVATAELSELEAGQFLVRVIWLSLDPYMRGRMASITARWTPKRLVRR